MAINLEQATAEAMDHRITLPILAKRARISLALLRQSRLGKSSHGHRTGRPEQVRKALIELCDEAAHHFEDLADELRKGG